VDKHKFKLSLDEKSGTRKLFVFVGMTLGQIHVNLKTGGRETQVCSEPRRERERKDPDQCNHLTSKDSHIELLVDHHGGTIGKFAAIIQKGPDQSVNLKQKG